MDFSLGRISGQLADPGEKLSPDLIDLLNANIAPPEKISAEDIHIRAMYIVSDEVNCYGGKFSVDEHEHLAGLLIDSPVMVGHRKDKLPVGRTFHARLIRRKGRNWIKSYFYWLKNAEGVANLKENIDGGIYKECSIGFTFALPECSVCGKDIRLCLHEPLESYEVDGEDQSCYFNYRKIEKVLETSLVYRGAISDTSVSNDLQSTGPMPESSLSMRPITLTEITDIGLLQNDCEYLVIPRYESLAVSAVVTDGCLQLLTSEGNLVPESVTKQFPVEGLPPDTNLPARLVGYRGKERCSFEKLCAHLNYGIAHVSRLVLMFLPHSELSDVVGDNRRPFDIRMIPCRWTTPNELLTLANEIKTRDGVEVWPLHDDRLAEMGFYFKPDLACSPPRSSCSLEIDSSSGDGLLWLCTDGVHELLRIHGFKADLASIGRRFVADQITDRIAEYSISGGSVGQGRLTRCETVDDGKKICAEGKLGGEFVLRPITLDGAKRFLFYRRKATGCESG